MPSLFATNMQNEINLHNFKTDAFESAYYFLASIIFLALPILCWRYRKLFGGGVIRIFYPSMLLIPYGFVIVSCTYDMWNEPLTQYSFFTGCFIMIFLAVKLPGSSLFKVHILDATIVGVTNLIVFFSLGHRFQTLNDSTEYKELWISFALLVFAFKIRENMLKQFQNSTKP
jgi:hypothetical protein